MPGVMAAQRELLRHAAATASPTSIHPVVEAIVKGWTESAQGAAGQAALQQALRDLAGLLRAAAGQAKANGRIFEGKALDEAIAVLDATSRPPGMAP